MTTETLRLSLNAAVFPFLYRNAQRMTILPGLDQNVRAAGYSGPESFDWGVPQLLYCENVMPIARGYLSVQFTDMIEPFDPPATDFDQAIIVRDAEENTTIVVPAEGKNYLLDALTGTWSSVLPFVPTEKLVTRAYVNGRSFIFYEKQKLFEFNGTTLVDVTASLVFPTGFSITDIRGIGGASNYLLLFTEVDVLWSSPNDILNFDRALNNGSGYQIPQDVRGRISCILPVSGGAIIYTVRNAVAVVFTNNALAPFAFRGISNSGGVASYEQVAYDADEKFQYTWGSGGMQRVSLQVAEGCFPELSDFLTSGLIETWDSVTKEVETSQVGAYLSVKLTYVSQRYLVVSYGQTTGSYSFAFIFDHILQRWGKVKFDHTDAFTYPYPNILGDLSYSQLLTTIEGLGDTTIAELGIGVLSISPPRKSIAFMQTDGSIYVLAIDETNKTQKAVAIFGQIQHNRARNTTLSIVEIEGADNSADDLECHILTSINGKDAAFLTEYEAHEITDNYMKFFGDRVGKNHQIVLNGCFNLSTLLVRVAKHGRAN